MSLKRLPGVDGLRAVSIGLVLIGHASWNPDCPHEFAMFVRSLSPAILGVDVFFAISGFLITKLLLDEERVRGTIGLQRFYLRRFVRLMPAYYAFLLVVYLLDRSLALGVTATEFIASLLYVRNYADGSWYTMHLWSLAVEEQFYFCWPLLCAFAPRRWRVPLALLVMAVAPAARVLSLLARKGALPSVLVPLEFGFPGRTDAIMAGCLLALVLAARPALVYRLTSLPALSRTVAFAALFAISTLGFAGRAALFVVPFGGTVKGLAASFLVASYTLRPSGLSSRLFAWRPVEWIGQISYSLYLWQQLVLGDSQPYVRDGSVRLPAALGLLSAGALLSYYALERPLLALRDRLRSVSPRVPELAQDDEPPSSVRQT
jgi:peptidoglycan/LPS O-acetylase OafA/YrhL